tara:strand:+ start:159 stop:434 length:276 start_codon:yes stop_codon:yes gene_type:complete
MNVINNFISFRKMKNKIKKRIDSKKADLSPLRNIINIKRKNKNKPIILNKSDFLASNNNIPTNKKINFEINEPKIASSLKNPETLLPAASS